MWNVVYNSLLSVWAFLLIQQTLWRYLLDLHVKMESVCFIDASVYLNRYRRSEIRSQMVPQGEKWLLSPLIRSCRTHDDTKCEQSLHFFFLTLPMFDVLYRLHCMYYCINLLKWYQQHNGFLQWTHLKNCRRPPDAPWETSKMSSHISLSEVHKHLWIIK